MCVFRLTVSVKKPSQATRSYMQRNEDADEDADASLCKAILSLAGVSMQKRFGASMPRKQLTRVRPEALAAQVHSSHLKKQAVLGSL